MRMRDIQRVTSKVADEVPMPASARPDVQAKDLLEVLWRGRWIVLLSVVVCLGTAWVYLHNARPQYTSSSRIFVEQGGPKIISTSDGGFMPGGGNFLPTQCEVLKSATIVSIAAESSAFSGMKSFAGMDSPVGAIKAGLEVEIGKNNDIITVSYTSPYPADSAEVVNRLIDAYKKYQSQQKQSSATIVLGILKGEKDKREVELKEKLTEKLDFMKTNNNLVFESDKNGDRVTLAIQRLNGLTDAINTARLAVYDAQANLAFAKETVAEPAKLKRLMASKMAEMQVAAHSGASGFSSIEDQQLQTKLHDLQEQLELLHDRYLPNHQMIRDLKSRVELVKAQLVELHAQQGRAPADSDALSAAAVTRFGDVYLSTAEERYEIAKLKQDELEKTAGGLKAEETQNAIDANNKAAIYAIMDADYRRTQQLCDQLQTRINEIHVTEDAVPMSVTLLEQARPSARPSKPDRPKILSVALILGLALGLGLAFTNAWMDQRLRSVSDIQAALDTTILGGIPDIAGANVAPSIRGRQVHLEPRGDVAECYRTVRTGIYFGVPDSRAKTLLMTSPEPGDGKTTTASNVAITMAQAGQRTLIVDADFRRPVQHKVFGVDATHGLSSVVTERATLEQAIKPSGIDKLDVLPCGPIPPNPAELLNSQEFADVIALLCQQYDQIIIDSPPVIPVTDARILGAMCDITILVVRAEKSTRKAAMHARDMLAGVGSNILGVVVNAVPRRQGRYGYYYGYSYYGGYRYGNEHRNGPEHVLPEGSHEPASGNGNGHAITKVAIVDRLAD